VPELPEVETIVRGIRPRLLGRRIRDAEVRWARTLGGLTRPEFDRRVVGATVAAVWRRGKHIAIDLERRGRPAGCLLGHLRMSGRLQVEPRAADPGPYARVRLGLGRGEVLTFVDVRKFGRLRFVADARAALARLGPEPLGPGFTAAWLRRGLRDRRRMLKPLLLDQTFLAGLGNIYVDESLHRARLHPSRRSDSVPAAAAERLWAEIRAVLSEAIEREGSSFDTFYRTPAGRPGSYQASFRVYGRDGDACRACGATIRKLVVGQRGTHVCPRCQRAPRSAIIPAP